ncbi:hypothetical protein [Streptomyces sp. SID13726]|uniref:hypothetical protein n=1 Tax=Streptomyces sp. SID13726 TaxID=2706058 RepID=UPI0013B76051|nr:hypothetical protein [Streptomyces sp. SID13726]NEA98876.1 hypothetical protein [Streptomyces sp. SID13726]
MATPVRLRIAVLLATVTAVTAVTAVGCGATSDQEAKGVRQDRKTPGVENTRELTTEERLLIERAEQTLVERCMAAGGFRFWPTPAVSAAERQGHGYVLDDIHWARTHGYGGQLEKKAEKARLNDPNTAYANALPATERIRYSKTLDGDPAKGMLSVELPSGGTVQTPRSGCWNRAAEQLYGDIATWFRAKKTATSLTPLYVPDLLKDRRLTSAVTAWSRCMREAGHAYADPDEIRAKRYELTKGMSPRQTHATEVELAVAEATCAQETSLGRTARELEHEYRTRNLRRYSDDIATYQRLGLTAVTRAKKVTGSTP